MTAPPRKRHGCLTVWLFLIIIANLLAIIVLATGMMSATEQLELPVWYVPVVILLSVIEIVFAVALFRWKKWGFWGFAVFTAASVIISAVNGDFYSVISGVISLAILYGVLNIGGENRAWPQLE